MSSLPHGQQQRPAAGSVGAAVTPFTGQPNLSGGIPTGLGRPPAPGPMHPQQPFQQQQQPAARPPGSMLGASRGIASSAAPGMPMAPSAAASSGRPPALFQPGAPGSLVRPPQVAAGSVPGPAAGMGAPGGPPGPGFPRPMAGPPGMMGPRPAGVPVMQPSIGPAAGQPAPSAGPVASQAPQYAPQQHVQEQMQPVPAHGSAPGAAGVFQPGQRPPGPPMQGLAPPGAAGMPLGGRPPMPGTPGPGIGPAPPAAPGFPSGPPGPHSAMGPYGGQRLVEQFESLMLSAGPGAPEADSRSFPRPTGDERAAAHAHQPPFDRANCSSDNMRPTVMGVPNSTALRLRWQLPLGVIVRPMADEALGRSVPVIPLGNHGIVRCRRCRTYMNPFCAWLDGGRRFKCNVCGMQNEVPVEYFSTLDANGVRRDISERPELHCGTVEWVAPQEYMVRPPMPPVYFFAIDVSQAAYACGMVAVVAETIRSCLDDLPGDERTMVGFLTFDSSLHFYNLKASLAAPQMLVVTELDDPFLPMPDDLLVNLSESRAVVEALLDALPAGYNSSTSNDSAMGPALQAAFLVMGHVGGKLLLFQSGLPTLGPGKLKPSRENLNLYNTDREAQLRNPEDPFFKRFAGEASSRQITLDVFLGTTGYADLASLSSIPRYTCGQVYHYPGFHASRDGPKLSAELRRNLTRATAWEAVMRIRCSRGLKITSFHGHFFNRSTDLLALPTCDPDKSFAVQIGHEETVVEGSVTFVQCALLHTSSNGERRIRVHTMVLPVLSELSELYRAADGAATVCLLAKLGVEKSLMAKLEDTRQALMSKLSLALKEYRLLHGAHVRNPGALIYPSTLKYLPAYVLGLTKSTAFRGTGRDVPADERSAAAHALMAASVDETLQLAYPDLYNLTCAGSDWGKDTDGKVVLPATLPDSMAYLSSEQCFLIDNGQMVVLWVGRDVSPAWLAQVLGPDSSNPAVELSTLPLEPPRADSALSQRLCRVIAALRSNHTSSFAPAFAVRQGSPLEALIVPLFVEDRAQGQFGYVDFLHQLQRNMMNK